MNFILDYSLYVLSYIVKKKYNSILLCYNLSLDTYEFCKNPKTKMLDYIETNVKKKSAWEIGYNILYQCCITSFKIFF